MGSVCGALCERERVQYRNVDTVGELAMPGYRAPSFVQQDAEARRSHANHSEWSDAEAIRTAATACRTNPDFDWREEALLDIGSRADKSCFMVNRSGRASERSDRER